MNKNLFHNKKLIVFTGVSLLVLLIVYFYIHYFNVRIDSNINSNKIINDTTQPLVQVSTEGSVSKNIGIRVNVNNYDADAKYGYIEHSELAIENESAEYFEHPSDGEDRQLQSDIQGLFSNALNGEWEDFNTNISSIENIDPSILDFALLKAIEKNAPFNVIENLLNRGASLNPISVHMLTLNNNVTLAKKLMNYGLDIHTLDKEGKNAIFTAVKSFRHREMFDFLLSNNIRVEYDSIKDDPLLIALKLANTDDAGLYYVTRLVEYGAAVQSKHKVILSSIKESNYDAYSFLVENFHQFN